MYYFFRFFGLKMDPDMLLIYWDSPYIKIKEENIKNHSMGCCGYHGNQWHNPFFLHFCRSNGRAKLYR